MIGLTIAVCMVAFFCWLAHVIETSPNVEDAGYGFGVDCINCNQGNDSCKTCPVKKRYNEVGRKYVTYGVLEGRR